MVCWCKTDQKSQSLVRVADFLRRQVSPLVMLCGVCSTRWVTYLDVKTYPALTSHQVAQISQLQHDTVTQTSSSSLCRRSRLQQLFFLTLLVKHIGRHSQTRRPTFVELHNRQRLRS